MREFLSFFLFCYSGFYTIGLIINFGTKSCEMIYWLEASYSVNFILAFEFFWGFTFVLSFGFIYISLMVKICRQGTFFIYLFIFVKLVLIVFSCERLYCFRCYIRWASYWHFSWGFRTLFRCLQKAIYFWVIKFHSLASYWVGRSWKCFQVPTEKYAWAPSSGIIPPMIVYWKLHVNKGCWP